CQQYHTAPYSF
nr:immunoglobulin light chain junction region [Macaca mulatta]